MALLVVVAVYDLYHMIIPNRLVVYLSLASFTLFLLNWWLMPSWWMVGDHVLAASIGFSFFAGLWWYSGGRWIGFGDAKLAVPLAFTLGTVSTVSMIVYAFWIGTVISVTLLLVTKMRGQRHLRFLLLPRTMKSEVPFAPFLILGFLTVWFFAIDVLTLTDYVFLWWL
jgi:Flp pilus assembly protein protease CpaA